MRRTRKIILGLVAVAVVAFGWMLLAPRQVPGGSAFYLVPSGTSMLPSIHRGDLVIVREAERYSIGDVAAFESRDLGKVVLHRIVGRDGSRYVFKGDNNDWIDADRPSRDELIGKLWVKIPRAGSALEWIRDPQNAAVVGTMAGLVLAGGIATKKMRRRGRRKRHTEDPTSIPSSSHPASQLIGRGLLVLFLAVALGSLGLGIVSFNRPLNRTVTTEVPYRQSGTFAYSAQATPGAVYPDGTISTGEPVFLRLADEIRVELRYVFSAESPHAVSGRIALQAQLEDGTGWERPIELAPAVAFSGDEATVSGVLDLRALGRLMNEVDELTGIAHASFSLVVSPVVEVSGVVAGERFEDSFSPILEFVLDPLVLQVRTPQDPNVEVTDLVTDETAASVSVRSEEANRLSMWVLDVEVAAARRAAMIGGIVAAALGLILVPVALRVRRRDEEARIQARYGRRIVPMTAPARELGAFVDVASMEALARVAETYERMILHGTEGEIHSYIVEGDVVVYRYRTGSPSPDDPVSRPTEPPPAPSAPPPKPRESVRPGLFGRLKKRSPSR